MFSILPQLCVCFGAEALADSPSAETYMEEDMATILGEWGETLTVLRDVETYSYGVATHSWTVVGTISGEWQPISGKTVMMEASMETKSEAVVYCSIGVNVVENDKLQRTDGSFMFANYIRKHEDHWAIFLKKNM
jgi:hypothetical protein